MIEPTADEKKNGWTAKTLTKYIEDQKQSRADYANDPVIQAAHRRAGKPCVANGSYDPREW